MAMPIRDGIGFWRRRMMVFSPAYKQNPHEKTRVLPSFRPPKEKPYVLLVACINDGITKVAKIDYDEVDLARLGFLFRIA
jgi:hypothetical protein